MTEEEAHVPKRRHLLGEMSGATVALTTLAVFSVAAVVSAPVWLWYRRKRKRTDELLRRGAALASEEPGAKGGDEAPDAGTKENGQGQ